MFKLALALGMTVAELGNRMSYHELMEWIAFYNLEPFGDEWRQVGMQCSTIANYAPFRKGRGRQIEEFMPIRQREQTAAEARGIFQAAAKASGNKIIKHTT